MGKVYIKELEDYYLICNKCKHKWHKRGEEEPLICPKCKSARWDKEPKQKKKK